MNLGNNILRELSGAFGGLSMIFGLLGGFCIVLVNTVFVTEPINCNIAKTNEIFQICNGVIFNGYLLEGLPTSIAIISFVLYLISKKSSVNIDAQRLTK